ncbi:AMP-dependent synthetase/ligase [Actinomadura vinacea]|uniref:Acyl-CoA synthetase n=1 Tax=Actinomadura vinacea TaxID=115336 RepID=A0ABN3IEC4_9ACTN
MREYSVEALVEIADDDTLTDMAYAWAHADPDRAVLDEVTCGRFAGMVRAQAKELIAAGVRRGDRVVVLGPTSVAWAVADFAVLSVGAITVPIYPTASAEQIDAVLRDARPAACFTVPDKRALVAGAVRSEVRVWTLGEPAEGIGVDLPDAVVDERRAEVGADDIATIVYTSGTTGTPKGCVLTHRNILAAAGNVVALLPELFRGTDGGDRPSTLLFLPLAHVYGRVVLFGCVAAGTRTGLVGSPNALLSALPSFRPTFLVGVPYILEKIRKAARARVGEGPDGEAGAWVRGLLGGRLTHMICGGASLDASTLDFFTRTGLTVLGAYGLTETTSTVTMSAPSANRPGSVGRPVPGTTVAVAEDGEILVRGPQVSPGYWPDHAGGAPDEWVRTGDLGELDQDGYLRITGRRKEILVTSGGKNVAPAPLEDRLRLHPLVSNCMVVGEGRPFVTALVTLDRTALGEWRGSDLDTEIAAAVDSANALVSRAESIRRFRVLEGDFTVEGGQLTPSLRLRRAVIEKEYAAHIEAMYLH